MKVLITGATGQLGSELCLVLADSFEVIPASRKEFDITDLGATWAFILARWLNIMVGKGNADTCRASSRMLSQGMSRVAQLRFSGGLLARNTLLDLFDYLRKQGYSPRGVDD